MRLLYFYQYFSTPHGAWGTRVYDFARNWVKQGHSVTVVTAIYAKSDLKATKLLETQIFEGIKVKLINVIIDNKQSKIRRILSFIRFSSLACIYAISLPCDVVISSSGPISIGLPGLLARYLRGKKLVFEVRDLWPQGAIELGIIRNPFVKWISYKFEQFCYKSSDLIVALSPGIKESILHRDESRRVVTVTNGADMELFGAQSNDIANNIYGYYAIYSGNIGEVNNSMWLFEAARILNIRGRNDIKILLIGDGPLRELIEKRVVQENIPNLFCIGLMPKVELVSFIQNALVALVPLKGTPVLDHSSPNKLFEALSAGVPVIQTTQGWIKRFLEENSIGFTISPNDPNELVDLLILIFDQKQKIKEMGIAAREIAKRNFDKDHLARKMIKEIERLYD